MSLVAAVSNVVSQFKACSKSPDTFRVPAFFQFLRMQTRVVLSRRYPSAFPMPESARIFGRTWVCPSYEAALGVFKEVFLGGEYHFTATSCRPLIVDAGANIGLASLSFHVLYPGCRVLAFEPDANAFVALRENVRVNRLSVECVNAAVGSSEGVAVFYTDPENEGGVSASVFAGGPLSRATEVQVCRISQYVNGSVDLLKLDVEGAETAVLEELSQSGKLHEIKQAIIEFHPHKGQPGNSLRDCLRLLKRQFSVHVSDEGGITMIRASALPKEGR
jgi:FkbM family methyltransferase